MYIEFTDWSRDILVVSLFGVWQVLFDYEVDSDDDWEEEEPGESLSDCEKKDDDDDEVRNCFKTKKKSSD